VRFAETIGLVAETRSERQRLTVVWTILDRRERIGNRQPYPADQGRTQPDAKDHYSTAYPLVRVRFPDGGRCWVRTNVG